MYVILERFKETIKRVLLTKDKIVDILVHVIVMFTFISSLYFYISAPAIGDGLRRVFNSIFLYYELPPPFTPSQCPDQFSKSHIDNLEYNITNGIYQNTRTNNNLVIILAAYICWLLLVFFTISYVQYNNIYIKWILITNLSLFTVLAPLEYIFVISSYRYSPYNPTEIGDFFLEEVIRNLNTPAY